jgi:hypothetical protein
MVESAWTLFLPQARGFGAVAGAVAELFTAKPTTDITAPKA